MDKQTLSNYGWLVIVTLILAVMLALATPFGTYVGDGVVSVANGFVSTSNNATSNDNIDQNSVEWAIKADHGIGYKNFKYFSDLKNAVSNTDTNSGSSKLKNNDIVIATGENETPIVRLTKNITLKDTIQIDKSFVLDTNGYTLTIECEKGFTLSNGVNFIVKNSGKIIHNTVETDTNITFDATGADNYTVTFDGGEYILNFDKGSSACFFQGCTDDDKIGLSNITAKECTFTFNSQKTEEVENKVNSLFYTDESETISLNRCCFNVEATNTPTIVTAYLLGDNSIKNCTFNANIANTRVYSVYSYKTISVMDNCNFNINQNNSANNAYNIYNYAGTMTLNNCSTNLKSMNSSASWITSVTNSGGTLTINGGTHNIYTQYNADCTIGISTTNGGITNANNINVVAENVNTSISSGMEESSNGVNEHYVYTMHTSSGGILNISKSNVLAKGTDVQVTPFRLQSASTANISNTNIEAILTRVAPPNGDMGIDRYMREYVIFANHKPVNTVNIDNSYIKGHYAFYNGSVNNLINIGENMTYDITSMYGQ